MKTFKLLLALLCFFIVTASDQSANESVKSATVIKRIDRLAPEAPR